MICIFKNLRTAFLALIYLFLTLLPKTAPSEECSANRIYFGEAIRKPVARSVELNGGWKQKFTGWQAFQENAIKNGNTVIVHGLSGGLPFFADPNLKVDERKILCSIWTVKIERIIENVLLIPSKDSAVPEQFEMTQRGFSSDPWIMAVGVVWEFPEKGMKFKAGEQIFISTRAGAQVKFTHQGLILQGIEELKE